MLLAKENNGYYVCNNPYSMREKAKAYGITILILFHTEIILTIHIDEFE